jgi:signal transduction histidine kinase
VTSVRATTTPTWRVLVPAVLAVAVIGILDHFVGPTLTLAPFYLLPIAAVAWWTGRSQAVALALLSTTASLIGDISNASVDGLAPYWNAGVRLPVLIAAALLFARLRALVDEERAAARSMNRAAQALQEANEIKTTFMQAVAHDVRSPVSAIFGAAASLQTIGDELDPDDRERLVESLVGGSRRLLRILDDLLDLERLDLSKAELRYEEIDADRLLHEMSTESGLADNHPVIHESQGTVATVDRVVLERIAFNLATNISRHVPRGAPVWIKASARDGMLILSFKDAGPGIPDEAKQRIFEAFERGVDSSGAGFGMGLALVARFAALHGGRAWVEDRPGGGASFHVELLEGRPDLAVTA